MFTRALAFFAAAVMSLSAAAAGPEVFEGHDYARLKNPQPVSTGNQVEVLEFFWYRCPHCFQLEPALNTVAEKRCPRTSRFAVCRPCSVTTGCPAPSFTTPLSR